MPHLTLEYTNNLPGFDAPATLLELNKILAASGHFEESDIKSRAIQLDTFLVGTLPNSGGFVHIKLAIMSGRSTQTKRELSESMLLVLNQIGKSAPNTPIQLCVEVLDIDREVYAKRVINVSEEFISRETE